MKHVLMAIDGEMPMVETDEDDMSVKFLFSFRVRNWVLQAEVPKCVDTVPLKRGGIQVRYGKSMICFLYLPIVERA
jgi:hypothetical protein